MSALAGTISAPFSPGRAGFDAMRLARLVLSLALVVAILAIALPAAFGAGARSGGADPLQVFSSGPALSVDVGGGAQLAVSGIVPGQSRSSDIRLSNAGSEAVRLSLATHLADHVGPGGEPLSHALTVRVASPSGTVLYAGSLAGLRHLSLGTLGAGRARILDFTVALPADAGNRIEGSASSATFAWIAS